MNAMSQVTAHEIYELKVSLEQRVVATKQATSGPQCADTLMKLSRELRAYSQKNRAIAEALRQQAKKKRLEVVNYQTTS